MHLVSISRLVTFVRGKEAECSIYERVGKYEGPIYSRLFTKDHDILGNCRESLVVSIAVSSLSISRFTAKIFVVNVAVKLRSRRKTSKIGSFGAPVFRTKTSTLRRSKHINSDLVGGEVTNGAVRLRRFELFQAPLQVFQRLHSQLLPLVVCI